MIAWYFGDWLWISMMGAAALVVVLHMHRVLKLPVALVMVYAQAAVVFNRALIQITHLYSPILLTAVLLLMVSVKMPYRWQRTVATLAFLLITLLCAVESLFRMFDMF